MRFALLVRSFMFAFMLLAVSGISQAQIRVAITIAPPELVTYEQPVCPGDGYIWTPGYWSYDYDDSDYFWVPGTWVEAPEVGFLWTPGYWGWEGGGFLFHEGYWGPEVGFYGGISYGFGYFGHGYEGGRWDNGHFFYNTTVNNVNVTVIHNVYNTRINETTVNRVSFNGGNGGISARPTAHEEAAANARHVGPVAAQTEHVQAARTDPQQRASVNHGAPAVAATPKPGALKDNGVVRARNEAAPVNAGARTENATTRTESNGDRPATAVHPKDLPAMERPAPPNTGNPNTDKKYQQQQQKLQAKQDQERQTLQQKQDQEHQKAQQTKADDSQTKQMEQRHQQQTQQLQQKHVQQQQQLQQKQAPRPQPKPTAARPQ